MNIIKSVLVLAALSVSSVSFADVNVKLHRDLEFMVINGEELGFNLGTQKTATVPNGQNQVVIRVSKLLPKGSAHEKFNSRPMVVTFDASDTELEVVPTRRIESSRDVSGFDLKPSIDIRSSGAVDFHQGVLQRGPGVLPDIQRDLALFNKTENILVGSVANPDLVLNELPIAASVQLKDKIQEKSGNRFILLQADFLRMTQEQQKSFLSWAVQNVQ
ncbi:DUF2057 family protein [Enterovibrio baiacu]|uniref:YccT family protein n=1 Tax=Enterovibrio baiacu TaxID=2491023 RepID=UPI0010121AAF|nr:DUF2057 family protein [Enterovibrio baiacu]MBE1274678.1 DUF2057 domain-containing protein [Enterovibrio baiacu]